MQTIKNILYLYIRYNLVLFLLISFLFALGTITGIVTVNQLPQEQLNSLSNYLDNFITVISEQQSIEYYNVFLSSLSYNSLLLGLIWILGITMVGIPVIVTLVFFRGLSFGFTVGFLIDSTAIKGVLLTLLAILPHNILFIPCFFMVSVASISFSLLLIKNQVKSKSISILPELMNYTLLFIIIGIGFVAGSLIEAYISPTFMRLLLEYF